MTEINIDKQIMERIKGKIPTRINPRMNLNSIKVKSMTIDAANFELDDNGAVFLPEEKVYDIYENCNNSSERRGWTETLSLNKVVNVQRSVSFTKVVNSKFDVKASFKFPSVGGSAGFSKSITVTNNKKWSESKTITENRSRTIDARVNANSVLFIRLEKTIYSVRIPFSCLLKVDGVIEANYLGKKKIKLGPLGIKVEVPFNKIVKYRISDLLKDNELTFETSGFIENSSADKLSVSYFEREYNPEIDDCSEFSIDKIVQEFEQGISNLKSIENIEVEDLEFSEDNITIHQLDEGRIVTDESRVKDANFGETIEEYFDSITIQTSNSIGGIYVRHLSFGPGFCSVETTSSLTGNTISHLAPPAIWSDWFLLDEHTGSFSINISDTVNCDTGVRSQVKYWK